MKHATTAIYADHPSHGPTDPYLAVGEIVDLHPVYAAMALAREAAEANGTEPADVSWDPAWADLEIDNDEYWNDLVGRNWETLSCWYAMSLRAGRKGKLLHIKVDNGVESSVAIGVAPGRATEPLINTSANDAPLPNCAMIRSHVEMLHMLAKSAASMVCSLSPALTIRKKYLPRDSLSATWIATRTPPSAGRPILVSTSIPVGYFSKEHAALE